jgi:hypothetical protein
MFERMFDCLRERRIQLARCRMEAAFARGDRALARRWSILMTHEIACRSQAQRRRMAHRVRRGGLVVRPTRSDLTGLATRRGNWA